MSVLKFVRSIFIVIGVAMICQPAAVSAANPPTSAKLLSDRVFIGRQKLRVASALALPLWAPVRNFMLDRRNIVRPDMRIWVQWAKNLKKLPLRDKLATINQRVNSKFDYVSDAILWHEKDYWESPAEAVSRGGIDCEGFAIFKMYMAFLAGIPLKDMAILVGRVSGRDRIHAVLAATDGTTTYMLDNRQIPIVEPGDFEDFKPAIALGMDDVWVFPKNLR